MAEKAHKTRLLILTLIFPPDGVSTAQLLGEIAEDLHGGGFEVSVLTTSPHYNVDASAQAAQPISWSWHRLAGRSQFGNISVTHIRMPKKAAGKLARSLQWGWFHLMTTLIGVTRRKRLDVILTVSPPPTIAAVAGLLHRISGAPFVFGVWELYPEILVKLGKLKRDSKLHKVLQRIERATYRQAGAITVLHDPMKDAVISAAPSIEEKVHTVPTFADTDFLRPLDGKTALRKELGLDDRFVVGYAGNLGVSQDLTSVLESAHLLRDNDDVAFLIAGDGSERDRLERFASEHDLKNVIFTGHLPYQMVPELTATCDICIVTLADDVSAEALPSKVYRIMACGRPILAISATASPLASLVEESGTGLVCQPGNADELAATIRRSITEFDLANAGERARQIAVDRYSRPVVTARYGQLLSSLVNRELVRSK